MMDDEYDDANLVRWLRLSGIGSVLTDAPPSGVSHPCVRRRLGGLADRSEDILSLRLLRPRICRFPNDRVLTRSCACACGSVRPSNLSTVGDEAGVGGWSTV